MTTSSISLGESTADGILHTGNTRISAVQVISDGTNVATVILYDNTAASGTKVFEGGCLGATQSRLYEFNQPIKCKNGIYLDIAGTGASVIVYAG